MIEETTCLAGDVDARANGGASPRVADYLRQAILDEEIGVGEKIRQETLASRLGSSRLPVREALRTLEVRGWSVSNRTGARGLRSSTPRSCTSSTAPGAASSRSSLPTASPTLTTEQVEHLDQILAKIEDGVGVVGFRSS